MDIIHFIVDVTNRINLVIETIVRTGGNWAYLVMFLILFTGAALVVTAPFLPSVSLIFLITSLCVAKLLNPFAAFFCLIAAVALGDLAGYYLGKLIGDKFIIKNKFRFIKAVHIEKTRKLYDGVSLVTMIFARFTPLVGSLAQLVAGTINYKLDLFLLRNVIAGSVWLTFNFFLGWMFSIIPALKSNYVMLTLVMPIFSGLITVIYFVRRTILSRVQVKRT